MGEGSTVGAVSSNQTLIDNMRRAAAELGMRRSGHATGPMQPKTPEERVAFRAWVDATNATRAAIAAPAPTDEVTTAALASAKAARANIEAVNDSVRLYTSAKSILADTAGAERIRSRAATRLMPITWTSLAG
jgi:hypothetical protein